MDTSEGRCICGCTEFVWMIENQGRYSPPMPMEAYNREARLASH